MSEYYFRNTDGEPLEPPIGKHLEILKEVLRPDPCVKPIDCCCGLGFAKTYLGIQAAAETLQIDGHQVGLFLEPDWDRVNTIFLPLWTSIVPEELYTIEYGNHCIKWWNGSRLYFRPRVITGSRERSRSKFRGIELTFVVDDETAIGFDLEQYQNTFARIRGNSSVRYYLTLSTPLVGPYGRFLNRGGNTFFRGRTDENTYLLKRDPTYVDRQRATMSKDQARRELDGELVALEGRIWKYAKWDATDPDCAWPLGNRNDIHTRFNPEQPYWLFCDLGSATGAYVVVQKFYPPQGYGSFGQDNHHWVAVADYCPDYDANAAAAFRKIQMEYGKPAAIVSGGDINTRATTDGHDVAYFVTQIFGGVPILMADEHQSSRHTHVDILSYLICSSLDVRRFTVARDFRHMADGDSYRGVREMLLEDKWPDVDKRNPNDYLPKTKDNLVQHTRDALLNGAAKIMRPPRWNKAKEIAAYE